jgi:uncharacterized protein YeaO (DUF488 family)
MRQRPEVLLRRVYDDVPEEEAEYRVLVDRIWPRGVRKADAALDEWLKDAAPTTELRRWYGHDPDRFEEFERRYRAELGRPPASLALAHLVDLSRAGKLTLLTATRDVEHSAARVLQRRLARAGGSAVRPGRRAPGARRASQSLDVRRQSARSDR